MSETTKPTATDKEIAEAHAAGVADERARVLESIDNVVNEWFGSDGAAALDQLRATIATDAKEEG